MSKHYGYNCTVCGEPIKEPQPTEHTDDGLAHAKCCRPKRMSPLMRRLCEIKSNVFVNQQCEAVIAHDKRYGVPITLEFKP